MIYLLTAIGLPPGGSSTVHIYTQTQWFFNEKNTVSFVRIRTKIYCSVMLIRLKHVGFASIYICWKFQSENTDIFYPKESEIFLFLFEYSVEVKNVYIKDSLPYHRSLNEKAVSQQRKRHLRLSLTIFTLLPV
jgi:hypothetical protein